MRALWLLLVPFSFAEAAILSFTATPSTAEQGEPVRVTWRADSGRCTLSALGQSQAVARVGSVVTSFPETTTVTFRCGTASRSLTVTVEEPEEPPPEPDPIPDPDPNPPPVTNCAHTYRGIPDPCAHFGFDVFADFTVDRVIDGVQSGSKTISGNGTAADPYVVDASRATFNVGRGSVTVTGQYVVFTCGKVNSTGESAFRAGASYSVYRDCDIGGNQTNQSHGAAISTASNTLFYNFKVHNFGILGANAPEQDQHGWKVKASNVWILNSEGYELSGDGIQCGDASNGSCSNVYIGGGHYHDNRENGIDIKDSQNVVVSGVRMDGFAATNSSPGEAMIIHDDAVGAKVYDNVIRDTRLGIVSSGLRDHVLDGNDIQASGADIQVRNTRPITIQNNLISDCNIQSGVTGTWQSECQ